MIRSVNLALLLVAATLIGCESDPPAAPPANAPTISHADENSATTQITPSSPIASKQNATSATDSPRRLAKVKFKDGAGKTAFSIKFYADGAKMVDGGDAELARFNYSPGKVKIKDEKDEVLGYIVGDAQKLKVEDPLQIHELFKLQPQDDGDWKFEDDKDRLIFRLKKRDYGFEIETPSDQRVSKVKVDKGKTSLRDANENTLFHSKDKIQPLSVTALGCDSIEDLRVRVGLLVAIERALAP